jgi:glycosyltransferase involved in cell wall biosynthesis|tara:strand:- start:2336 stop:3478 length:1143 start_codon:yes stop_codon:yes gene_type:complete
LTKITVLLPCLNEEKTVGSCIYTAKDALKKIGMIGEIIVIDNGSTDRSAEEARNAGAKVIIEPNKGYGNAYLRGFNNATGDIIVMGDADGTYPFETIPSLIQPILDGNSDVVIGSRLKGKIFPKAMPWTHKYIGNPLLSFLLNLLFKAEISDAHCGLRAISRPALRKLDLSTPGMEFASEMIIEAKHKELKISEIPIEYHPRKAGQTKMSSLKDGWRHLRFMLLYSPTTLFILPGSILFFLGLVLVILLVRGPLNFGNFGLDIHPMILGNLLVILGFQVIALGLFAKIYASMIGLVKPDKITKFFLRYDILEYEILGGTILFLAGFLIDFNIVLNWIKGGFGELSELRTAILGSTLAAIGIQLIFLGLFMSILLLKRIKD